MTTGILGTRAGLLSDVSLSLEFIITGTFLMGFYFARRRRINFHYKAMSVAFALDVSFMVSYMVKSLVEGRTAFQGPDEVYRYIYLPVVVFHSLISLVVLGLAGYMIYNGYKNTRFESETRKMLPPNIKKHRRIGKTTILAWISSFFSGISVYFLLYVY